MKNILLITIISIFSLQACTEEEKKVTDAKPIPTEVKQMEISKMDSVKAKIPIIEKTVTKDGKVQIDATSFIKDGKTSVEVLDKTGKKIKIDMTQPKVIANQKEVERDVTKTKVVKPVQKEAPSKNALPVNVEMEQPQVVKAEKSEAASTKPLSVTKEIPQTTSKEKDEKNKVSKEIMEFNHSKWNELLQKYVSDSGKVNYKGFQSDSKFETYLNELKNNPVQSDWSREKKMAYWINAYNAFTIKMITDNYPVSSITELEGGKPWDKKWITLGDKTYSLNNIENDILRPKYKDARIHFAVNCAAVSCPTLLNKAWTADNLESNFEKQAKTFINNSKFNDISQNKVSISKIFDWYAKDFGDITDYLNQYSSTEINDDAKVTYKEYDWALNKQ